MGTVSVHSEIAAPPSAVWAVLADLGTWADWNEVIVDGRCDGGEGARVSCKVRVGPIWVPVDSKAHTWCVDEALGWGQDMGRFLRIFHGFRLEASDVGTRIEHYESFEGLVGRALYPLVQRSLHQNYATFLDALKTRVESAAVGNTH